MQGHLIDVSLIHSINRVHLSIEEHLKDANLVPALHEVMLNQLRKAEADLMAALNRLSDKYIHIQELALMEQPSPELDELLGQLPEIETEHERHGDEDKHL